MEDIEGFVLTPKEFLQLPPSSDPLPPPPEAYGAFTELLVERKHNGFARIRIGEILDLIVAKCGVSRRIASHWLFRVREQYTQAGWEIIVDAPRKSLIGGDDYHWIFCAEAQLDEAALWDKYHPNDPMPTLTGLQRETLVHMRPGWGGWDNEEKRGFPYCERDRLEYMEDVLSNQKLMDSIVMERPALTPIDEPQKQTGFARQ